MDTSLHSMGTLFQQLGLPSDAQSIRAFIHEHRPLDPNVLLHQAPWWTPAQTAFLQESINQDADWAEAVDELDALLRHTDAEAAAEGQRK